MGFDYERLALGEFKLPSGWRIVKVQDVAVINEQSIERNYEYEFIEYIDIASVEKGTNKTTQVLPLREAPTRARRIVRDKDTLIATVRPNLEHYAFVKETKPNTVASTGFAIVTAKQVEPRYLYYYLTTKAFTEYLTRIADSHTSAYPAFNPDVIKRAELILPPEDEQRAIAHILGTLDDKIELNRRMNETLEQMARAIFKAWFVDFEPVRAKMEGRWKRGQSLPGLPAHLYDLFPDRLVDSELGEIPQGWKVGSVMDIIEISRNSILPLRYPDEFFDHFSIPAFDDGKMPVTQLGKEIKSNKFIVHPNSVLLSKLNPRIPRVWLPIVTEGKRSICSTEFIVAIPTNKTTREYIYALFSSFEFSRDFSLLVTGTSGSHQRVKPESLLSMCIVIPQSNIISEFTKIVKPFYKLCLNNLLQSATLSFLRNSLLPKLISGEIRIRDAERYLKERGL